jgi:predicted metal-dependent hydrolase
MAVEKIFVQIDHEKIELTGADKEAFIAQRTADQEAHALLEAEYEAKRTARANAIQKLAEIAGLTEDEINSIL